MIDEEDWAEIRWLHLAEGMSVKAIVRRLGLANTLRSQRPPRYERERTGSSSTPRSRRGCRVAAELPDMAAPVIAERNSAGRSLDRQGRHKCSASVMDSSTAKYGPAEVIGFLAPTGAPVRVVGHAQYAALGIVDSNRRSQTVVRCHATRTCGNAWAK